MFKGLHRTFGLIILIVVFVLPLVSTHSDAMGQGDELTIEQFALADTYVLILASNGKVYAWGENWKGQLGTTAVNYIPYPVIVPNLDEIVKVSARSATYANSAAIDAEGHVWTWGDNDKSQLGRAVNSGHHHLPGKVITSDGNVLSNIIDISLGERHMIALDHNGQVWGWGNHFNGQVGHGEVMNDSSKSIARRAVQVINEDDFPLSNIVKISAGSSHNIALDASGTVWVWGNNTLDSLGTGDTNTNLNKAHRLDPAYFGEYNVLDIASGSHHNLALVEDVNGNKRVYGWGANNVRQLGVTSFTVSTPSLIEQPDNPSFPNNIVGIGAGSDVSVIYAEQSGEVKVYTAGSVTHKKLGHSEDETGLTQTNFLEVQGVSNPDDIQFADYNGFLLLDGQLQGWGRNHVGQFGQGEVVDSAIGIAEAVTISNNFHTELSHISLSNGQLFPAFHPDMQEYIVYLGSEVSHLVDLDIGFEFPAATHAQLSYGGTNITLTSGQALSLPIEDVLAGMTLTTTALNGISDRTYQIHVERMPKSQSYETNVEGSELIAYPHSGQNIVHAVGTKAHDGGFILGYAATIEPFYSSTPLDFVHLIKTSVSGESEWSRIIGEPDTEYHIASIDPTADGGYVIAGKMEQSYESFIFAVKLNAEGAIEWQHNYNPNQYDGFELSMGRIIPYTTGQYVAIGFVNQYIDEDYTDNQLQIVLINLDANGQELTRTYHTFDERGYAYNFVFGDILALPDGSIDIIATYEDWDGYESILYMRLDEDDHIAWINHYPLEESFSLAVAGIIYGDDNEGFITGHTYEYGFVLPFFSDGSFANDMITYPELRIERAIPMSTGDVLVAGTILNYGDPDGFVISALNGVDRVLSEQQITLDIPAKLLQSHMTLQWLSDDTIALIGVLEDEDFYRSSPFVLTSLVEELGGNNNGSTNPPVQEPYHVTSAVSSMDGRSIQVVFDTAKEEEFSIDHTKFKLIGLESEVLEAAYRYPDGLRHTISLKLSTPILEHIEVVELQLEAGAIRNQQDEENTLQTISVLTPYERHAIKQALIGSDNSGFTIKHVVKALLLKEDVNRDGVFDRYDVSLLLDSIDSVIN